MKELKISRDENNQWVVASDKMPGFVARGRTLDEAIEKIKKAFNIYFPCGECKEPEK
ncbi:MAG: type II toxin-antitoxin system HicB family antitoxin [Deferribacteres bacterium]|nr:type II toxin-antitoxin system HicB family antitoxin [Deferribacteres bacterium]